MIGIQEYIGRGHELMSVSHDENFDNCVYCRGKAFKYPYSRMRTDLGIGWNRIIIIGGTRVCSLFRHLWRH